MEELVMDTVTMFRYGPAVIAVCSVAALTLAGVMLVCAYMALVKPKSKI